MGQKFVPILFVALFFLAMAFLPLAGNRYILTVLIFTGLFAIAATGLNWLTGLAGQLSFGHNAFVGIGAYGIAILTSTYGWPSLLSLLLTIALAAMVALVVGYATLRLRGHYLAMGTAALGLIAYVCFVQVEWLTNGFRGVANVPPLALGPFVADSDAKFFYVVWVVVGLATFASWRLMVSHSGRVLRAIKGNERAAEAIGIDAARYKLAAFVASAMMAALAGTLMAHRLGFVSPESVPLTLSIDLIVMIIVGGMGTLSGPIIGAMVVTLLPEALRQYQSYAQLIYGIILILVLIFAPRGISGEVGHLWRRFTGARSAVSTAPDGDAPATSGNSVGALLEIRGLAKRFAGVVAASEIGMRVESGQIMGLIGPNGAGKTTTLNLISGMMKADGGDVLLDGRSIMGLRPFQIAAQGMSRTFQKVKLYKEMSVLDHALVGTHVWAAANRSGGRDEALNEAWRVLRLTGLAANAGEIATNLPFGKQRLLEIARALAGRPRLLLLDEPAAGLNNAETDQLGVLLRTIRGQGVTILLIEHDMNLVMGICDAMVVLDFGRKIAQGTPAEIRANAEVKKAYLGLEQAA